MPGTHYKYYEDARTSYYEQVRYPTSFQNYTEIIHRTSHGSARYKSALPIKFKTLEFGDSQETVIKKMGKPRFISENNEFSPLVFFYKEALLNHKLLIQLHFFDKKFVLATQSIIDTDSKWRQIVKIIVLEKYSGEEKPILTSGSDQQDGGSNLVFVDRDNNKIFLQESINLNIIYSSGDLSLLSKIEEFTHLKLKKLNDDRDNLKAILKNSF